MFQTSVPGKWILTGEHSVVRGQSALVFPLMSKSLRLRFSDKLPSAQINPMLRDALAVAAKGAQKYLGEFGQKKNAKKIAKNFNFPLEKFSAESSIPISSGLGSSAALCVALAKWFGHKGYIHESETYALALEMEHSFHGKSSGMDVAVALSMQACEFKVGAAPKPLSIAWQPKIYLLDSGERSSTKASVTKVMNLFKSEREKCVAIDAKMKQSVELARKALQMETSEKSLATLTESFSLGRTCYEDWDLITPKMRERAQEALDAGAIAWKPTGSGAGGFILTLWDENADQDAATAIEDLSLFSAL